MFDFKKREKLTSQFTNDRFGMFIHWGLYSIPARGEWIQSYEKTEKKQYEKYKDEWNPVHFNADEWAETAKNAGMKYAVLTTKHHEGFCLFDSALTDYTSNNTVFGRDIVREFVDAFRARGIKIGFYYSLLDWHHDDYPAYGDMYHPSREDDNYKDKTHNFDRYLDYMHGQVRELMTNYGKIDILWFDFSYENHLGSDWRGNELVQMVRELQPEIIMNGRLEANGESYGTITGDQPSVFAGDFACPEMIIPPNGLMTPLGNSIPWEACFTLNNNWGYTPTDKNYKTAEQIIRKLVECTSKNGNMLVNISPTAKGNVPQEQLNILDKVGNWLKVNGDSIYGCGAAQLEKPDWGRYTRKGNKLYAHIIDAPIGAIALSGVKGKIKKARKLDDGFEMLQFVPWVAKEFPDYEFINYAEPNYFHYDMGETPDRVIEIELFDETEK